MTPDWLIDLHIANFSNSLQQKITKLEPMNLPRFPSFSLPNPSLNQSFRVQEKNQYLKQSALQL